MPNTYDVSGAPRDYEAWRDLLRSMSGRYYSEGIEPNAFSGWVRPMTVCGFTTLDIEMFASTAQIITSRSFRPVASWR